MTTFDTLPKVEVDVRLPFRYHWIPKEEETEVVILLHGYCQRGERILQSLHRAIPEEFSILAPNGLFPVPRFTDPGYKEAYSWYFYDAKKRKMIVDPNAAIVAIQTLLEELNIHSRPLRIVGFSQGGYFGPLLAQTLPQTRQVIGLAAGFPERYYPRQHSFRLDAVSGALDTVCPLTIAQDEHRALLEKGWRGEFVSLESTEHRIDDPMRSETRRLLQLI